jgi:glyoxylase-like metal-dependent hydrolase (beta-lactamase superfamily II)
MVDTGYGIYHPDIMLMLSRYGVGDLRTLSRILVTHADADHCGASGFFAAPVFMHKGALEIIRTNNRAHGSRSDHVLLDEFYTKMINLFSRFCPPADIRCFAEQDGTMRGIFPVIGRTGVGDLVLEVLEGLGGHTCGQVFLYAKQYGLLFTADSLINFACLSKERADYSSLAAFLVTSVNVDSDGAKRERKGLLELVKETDRECSRSGRRCLVCGGHGAVSVLDGDHLVAYGEVERYLP